MLICKINWVADNYKKEGGGTMSYSHNLSNISLEAFKEILKNNYLIPSMRPLLLNIDEQFSLLSQQKITTVEEFYKESKTKKKAELLSESSGLDRDYMTLLKRLVSSYISKSRKLADYPDIDEGLVERLEVSGIKTSKALYEYLEPLSHDEIIGELGLEEGMLKKLWSLMAVTRLRYVSPLFATVLVRSGYDSIEKIADAKSSDLHQAIVTTNKKEHIYKGNVGDSDAQFLIDDAKVFMKYSEKKQL